MRGHLKYTFVIRMFLVFRAGSTKVVFSAASRGGDANIGPFNTDNVSLQKSDKHR